MRASKLSPGDHNDSPANMVTLRAYAEGLLRLLTGPSSVALNRAAMASPELAALLLAEGRGRTGAIVESYLARLMAEGVLADGDPAETFGLLYGLVVQDQQIAVLLGSDPPSLEEIAERAEAAVVRFLELAGR
ncbi:hypothetical protein HJ590_17040 [Naumannella sp. ID2617S]|nr:hypothetical protein [Naumannella sp. ID2617S]